MFKYFQFFLLMGFAGILFGAANSIATSTNTLIDVQGGLLMANFRGEIDDSEYKYRSEQADIVFKGSVGAELEKVHGVIVEAEDVFNIINSKMNLTQNTIMASGNFSEAIKSFQSLE